MFRLFKLFLHPDDGGGITFDTISDVSPDPDPEGGTGDDPGEGDPDPDPDNSDPDPDDKDGDGSDDNPEGGSKKDDPKDGDPKDKALEKALKLGENSYELKKLLEDEAALGEVQKLIDDGFLMRSDYSKKTEETARLKEELTGYKERCDTDYETGVNKIKDFLETTNTSMMETPLEFLRNTFSHNDKGETRTPEEIEQHVGSWIKTLTRHINDGSSYDPAAVRKNNELEKRLKAVETEKHTKEAKDKKTKEDKATADLRGNIDKKITSSIDKFGLTKDVLKEFPKYAAFLKSQIIPEFGKAFKTAYDKAEGNWDDNKFVENFNYEAIIEAEVKGLETFLESKYGKYLEKKRSDKSKKKTADGAKSSKKASSEPEGGYTFDNI